MVTCEGEKVCVCKCDEGGHSGDVCGREGVMKVCA